MTQELQYIQAFEDFIITKIIKKRKKLYEKNELINYILKWHRAFLKDKGKES